LIEPVASPELIQSAEAWRELLPELGAARRIGFDLEADGFHRYPERVSLLQVSVPDGRILLIDPLALEDLGEFGRLLASSSVEIVIHSSDYDLRCLDRDFGFRVEALYDTSLAAQFCGSRRTGLANVLSEFLGVDLDKPRHLQRIDWSQRPLPNVARDYAASDVVHLLTLADEIAARLKNLGRTDWVAEELARLQEIRYEPPDPPEVAYITLRGARRLSGRSLAVLRELYVFRDLEARRRGQPPYKVVSNQAIMELSKNPTLKPESVKGISRRVLERAEGRLEAAIQRGLRSAPVILSTPKHDNPWTATSRRRLSALKSWRALEADRLDLDRGLIWPAAHLDRVALNPDESSEALAGSHSSIVRRWQFDILGDSLARFRREQLGDRPGLA
jgi:ribonuclease D